jgi:hypothetical protein
VQTELLLTSGGFEDAMAIFMVVCAAAEGFLIYVLFCFLREHRSQKTASTAVMLIRDSRRMTRRVGRGSVTLITDWQPGSTQDVAGRKVS